MHLSTGSYGSGTYFHHNASYSNGYAYQHPAGYKQMFLAKVILGIQDTPGAGRFKKPAARPIPGLKDRTCAHSLVLCSQYYCPAVDTYDSVTDGAGMHIVYAFNVAYPYYLISYKGT